MQCGTFPDLCVPANILIPKHEAPVLENTIPKPQNCTTMHLNLEFDVANGAAHRESRDKPEIQPPECTQTTTPLNVGGVIPTTSWRTGGLTVKSGIDLEGGMTILMTLNLSTSGLTWTATGPQIATTSESMIVSDRPSSGTVPNEAMP
jgi:hypothetical protein